MRWTSLRNIMGLTVPKGKVALTWFNEYSGTVIRTPTSTLIFDPVGIRSSDVPRAEAIVITHEHIDHFEAGLTRDLQRQTGATVVTPHFVAEQLRDVPSEKLKALRIGDTITIGNVRLDIMPSDHPGNQPLSKAWGRGDKAGSAEGCDTVSHGPGKLPDHD